MTARPLRILHAIHDFLPSPLLEAVRPLPRAAYESRIGDPAVFRDTPRPERLTVPVRRLLETSGRAAALAVAAPPGRAIERAAAGCDARYRQLAAARPRRTA